MNRRDEHTLRRAHLLSLLKRTTDEQLAAFAEGSLLGHAIEEGRVRAARDLVDAIAEALETNDDALWQRVERARDALYGEPSPWTVGAQQAAQTADTDKTVSVEALRLGKAPLPFQGSHEPPPSGATGEGPHPEAGGTGFMPALSDVEESLPFAVQAVAPMSVERYAAFLADEERASASERAAVYRRHGIQSAEERQRLDQEMGRYLRRDAAARAKLDELLARYRGGRR